MEFCPICETKLVLSSGAMGVALGLSCSKCNYKKRLTDTKLSINKKSLDFTKDDVITVVDKKEDLKNLLTVRSNCSKCGNDLAFQWRAQTQWTDESATRFYRCTECGYTSRD